MTPPPWTTRLLLLAAFALTNAKRDVGYVIVAPRVARPNTVYRLVARLADDDYGGGDVTVKAQLARDGVAMASNNAKVGVLTLFSF